MNTFPHRLFTLLLLLFCFTLGAKARTFILPTDTVKTDSLKTKPTKERQRDLGEATVTATRLVFVTKKDTVIYDMDALGATKGDMLQDMISRMPGLEIKNGALYYRGKAVTRVQVNGTDFERGDTKKALQNLPAYIIKNVKAYEDLTDQAKVTGIDNGDREQVVNVILKKKYLGAWTGNVDLGYGTDHRWRYRGFANTFTEHSRVSAYGGFTNTGQYQSATDEGMWNENGGAGSSSGDTRYMQPGLSFMWNNGKQRGDKGYFMVDGSGGWDYRGHHDESRQLTENFLDDGTRTTRMEHMTTKNDERIWRINLSLTWQATKWTYLEYRPHYSYNSYKDRSHEQEAQWNGGFADNSFSPLDSLLHHPTAGWPLNSAQAQANTLMLDESLSDKGTHYTQHYLYFTQRLSENNWRLSLMSNIGYRYGDEKTNDLKQYTQYQTSQASQVDPLYNRYSRTASHDFDFSNYVFLDAPIPGLQSFRFTYGTQINRSHSIADAYRLERLGGSFANFNDYLPLIGTLPTEAGWQATARDPELTLDQLTLSRQHSFQNNLIFKKKGLTLDLSNAYTLVYDRLEYVKGDYDPLYPSRHSGLYRLGLNTRYETDSIGTFTFSYNYYTSNPPLLQTITLPDMSNPLYLSLGNPDLKKRHVHVASMGYQVNMKHGRMFSMGHTFTFQDNEVTTRSRFDKLTGVTTTERVNLPKGSWNYSPNLNFSTPLDKKQLVNFSSSVYYSLTKGRAYTIGTTAEAELYDQTNHQLYVMGGINARLGKWVLGLDNMCMYRTIARSTEVYDNVSSFMNVLNFNVQYTLPWNMVVKSNLQSSRFHNSGGYVIHPWRTIWNASIEQSFLRDKSLAVTLEASDLLNQRDQTLTSVDVNSRYSGWSKCVHRYFMLHVIYRFSTKKG